MAKRILQLFLVLLVIITLAGGALLGGMSCEKAAPSPPIKIAYVGSKTGIFSTMGVPAIEGITAYVERLNKKGGIAGHPVELFVYNDESDPVKGCLAMKKAIEVDKVHVVMGCQATGVALAVAPVAAEAKTPFISNSGVTVFEMMNKKAGPEQHRWNFRPTGGDPEDGFLSLAYLMKHLGLSKLAFLTPETGFGKPQHEMGKVLLPKLGVDLVVVDTYPGDATTFGAQVSKVKANPEVQAVTCYGAELATALAIVAFREAGFGDKVPLITWEYQSTRPILGLEKVRKAYEGLWFIGGTIPCWDSLPENDVNKAMNTEFAKFYEEAFGERLCNMFDVVPLTTQLVLEDALQRLFRDQPDILDKDLSTIRSAIRDHVEDTKTFCNGMGVWTMSPDDHHGAHLGTQMCISKFLNGKAVYQFGGDSDSEWQRFYHEMAPQIGWKGKIGG